MLLSSPRSVSNQHNSTLLDLLQWDTLHLVTLHLDNFHLVTFQHIKDHYSLDLTKLHRLHSLMVELPHQDGIHLELP